MATIEERAKDYADNFVVGDAAIIVDLLHKVAEESYVKGATEQKVIDDELQTEEMRKLNEEWKENFRIQRKMLIDKAREWFGEYLMEIGCPDDWMRDSSCMESGEKRFIKAMEK